MPNPRDDPWIFRTYAGHSTAQASNALFRENLARGQTGLSVAFDLPTQTGHDSDHPLAQGEVGKVGVPVCHLGDMRALFADIPLERMNTSMTINATAPWLLALYVAVAEEQGADLALLQGTVQNDLFKEYLSRGTYICPPAPSLRMMTDVAAWSQAHLPKWNPMNVCSYHLQEAGATPVEEMAFALAAAIAVLEDLQQKVPAADFPAMVGRMSFFVNAGIRFVTELCKMRAFAELWDALCLDRFGIADPRFRRFRYGVQVNSLGLTEQQPENNMARILIEMLAVTLSRNARARAVQLPAWNEALGLPRPWDQQWSLRMQQILAYETDLLEFDDLFDGNPAIAAKTASLKAEVRALLTQIDAMGGAVKAIDFMKARLVASNSARIAAIEAGDTTVVGVNAWQGGVESPLVAQAQTVLQIDPDAESEQLERLSDWTRGRDAAAVLRALDQLRQDAAAGTNIMPASLRCARSGVTTGEWAGVIRALWGEYRAPTGLHPHPTNRTEGLEKVRAEVDTISQTLGRRLKFLMAKPGLDGHSNGAEQISARARDCGMAFYYAGIRSTPDEIVAAVREQSPHVLGLSILSGAHLGLVATMMDRLRTSGFGDLPVIVGGIIPTDDAATLRKFGVARVYTPKDFELNRIMSDIVALAGTAAGPIAPAS